MGGAWSSEDNQFEKSDQTDLNPGQPHRRTIYRYLLFTLIQLFLTVGLWQIIVEIVEHTVQSIVFRVSIYALTMLLGLAIVFMVYDDNLDSAVN